MKWDFHFLSQDISPTKGDFEGFSIFNCGLLAK